MFDFIPHQHYRDHPERGNLHGRGHCWPVLRTLQPCWCYVLLQEGMWGSCRRRSHPTVLLWGAGVGILLSRTNANLHHVSWQLSVVWVIEILIWYCLLMPFRVCLAVFDILLLVLANTVVGQFPNDRALWESMAMASESGHARCYPALIGLVLISYSIQCLKFQSEILIPLLHRDYDGAIWSKRLFRSSRLSQDVGLPYCVFCCVLAAYAKME